MKPVMTPEQKLFYETNGYLVIENALPEAELAAARAAFDRAEARWLADPTRRGNRRNNERQIVGIIEYDDLFVDLMAHPKVFPIVREILGDDVSMVDNDGHVKPARSVTHAKWHHDVGMGCIDHPFSTLMVKVFWLLSDVVPDGGATAFLPGSHRYPMNFQLPRVDDPEAMPGHVRMAHPAGTAYLFNGRVYHAALSNHSDQDRKVVIINYGHFWMKPWQGYEPSERLQREARTPVLKQLLHVGDAYGTSLSDD
jgi:ectoine hydroxylase-related dioxygenase (phytanoyl-CoA dioxygenase family)